MEHNSLEHEILKRFASQSNRNFDICPEQEKWAGEDNSSLNNEIKNAFKPHDKKDKK